MSKKHTGSHTPTLTMNHLNINPSSENAKDHHNALNIKAKNLNSSKINDWDMFAEQDNKHESKDVRIIILYILSYRRVYGGDASETSVV